MKYTQVWIGRDGHRIYAREYPGQQPPILLLHGFPDNLHLYDRLVPHLSPSRRVVTFDFLGWGASDKPTKYPYTATNQTGDLDAVISQLGLDDVTLVARTWEFLDRRLYTWQVGRFIGDASARQELVPSLYQAFRTARPAFWALNDDLLGTVVS